MDKKAKIGISALVVGLGLCWAVKSLKGKDDSKPKKDNSKSSYDKFSSVSGDRIKASRNHVNTRKDYNPEEDLRRWGTREGIIDVSNNELVKRRKNKRLSGVGKAGEDLVKVYYPRIKKLKKEPTGAASSYQGLYKDLKGNYSTTQITLTNTSDVEREIRIWGANQGQSVSPPNPEDVRDHTVTTSVPVGNHPQGLVYNPVNQLGYVANQIDNTITVFDSSGQVVRTIQLEPSFPGFNSPVDITIDPITGIAYVAGSVSNTISVIDLKLEVIDVIPVGIRPVRLAFNPVNNQLYVVNLVDNSLSVVDVDLNEQVSLLPTREDPIDLSIDPVSGNIYVINSSDGSVSVFTKGNDELTIIERVGSDPKTITYNTANRKFYLSDTSNKEILILEPETNQFTKEIGLQHTPRQLLFNPANSFIYVLNDQNQFNILDKEDNLAETIDLGGSMASFNPTDDLIYVTNTASNQVNVIGYNENTSSLSISEDYTQIIEDFKHNPAIIKHAKFVLSGEERLKTLQVIEKKATGTTTAKSFSFSNYQSPQNFQNVSEVPDLADSVVDGKSNWCFKVPPGQTLSILAYYKQFDNYFLLPKT